MKIVFFKFSKNFLSNAWLKNFSLTTIIKLFMYQSEVSALPTGCRRSLWAHQKTSSTAAKLNNMTIDWWTIQKLKLVPEARWTIWIRSIILWVIYMFVIPQDNDNCIVPRVVLKLDYWHISISKPEALWVTNRKHRFMILQKSIDNNTEDTFWKFLDKKYTPKVLQGYRLLLFLHNRWSTDEVLLCTISFPQVCLYIHITK